MPTDEKNENDFDDNDDEDLERQMQEMFEKMARKMDKVQPGFKKKYDAGIKGLETFRNAVEEVMSEHDVWVSASKDRELGDEVLHILIYIDAVHTLAKRGMATIDDNYLMACVAEAIKWSFLRGMKYAELREAPDAFSDFINSDLNIE